MQYRIHQSGSLGPYLPGQLLTEEDVTSLRLMGCFEQHLASGIILPAEAPFVVGRDRTEIRQRPLPSPPADPLQLYTPVGSGVQVAGLEADEIDDLEEQLADEADEEALED